MVGRCHVDLGDLHSEMLMTAQQGLQPEVTNGTGEPVNVVPKARSRTRDPSAALTAGRALSVGQPRHRGSSVANRLYTPHVAAGVGGSEPGPSVRFGATETV